MQDWSSDDLLQAASWYLGQPGVAVAALILCVAIALGALLKVWRDIRKTPGHVAPGPWSGTTPGSADTILEPAPMRGPVWAEARDLGYSTIGRSRCQWKRDAIQPHAEMTRWVCSSCKGFAFSNDGGPPVTCRVHDPSQKI